MMAGDSRLITHDRLPVIDCAELIADNDQPFR
jgi:hypothetical protein